jgi:hypothetical protein
MCDTDFPYHLKGRANPAEFDEVPIQLVLELDRLIT